MKTRIQALKEDSLYHLYLTDRVFQKRHDKNNIQPNIWEEKTEGVEWKIKKEMGYNRKF